MEFSSTVLLAGGLAALVVVCLGVALFSGGDKSRGRVSAIDGRDGKPAFGRKGVSRDDPQARVAARLKELNEDTKKRGRVTLRLRLEQAGLDMRPAEFMLIFQIGGLVAAVGVWFLSGHLIGAAAVGVAVAFGLPRMVLSKLIERRRRKFLELFANALDVLVRGVRSGLPVNEGLKIIASEMEEPIKTEFRLVNDAIAIGLPLEEALERMAERVPSTDVDFFRTVLAIQKKTGGNLAESLSNLSEVLRERKKLKNKVRALSSEARMSAIIIGALPFIVGVLMFLLRPNYLTVLFTDETGQIMLAGGLVWMSFGVMMMRWMVKFDM